MVLDCCDVVDGLFGASSCRQGVEARIQKGSCD